MKSTEPEFPLKRWKGQSIGLSGQVQTRPESSWQTTTAQQYRSLKLLMMLRIIGQGQSMQQLKRKDSRSNAMHSL